MLLSPKLKKYITSVVVTSSVIFSAQTFAGAFQLWEESASSMGDYHAGAAAEALDASDVFYNPAGMTRIKHQQVSVGAAFIALDTNFQGNVFLNGVEIGSTQGTPGVAGDTFNIVPNFHYVYPINDRWDFGFEETTPFGLSTEYTDFNPLTSTSQNAYVSLLSTDTQLQTINLNPSLAFRINQYLSLGAGFDAMQGQATYDNETLLGPLTNQLSGWGYGYNAGVLLEFTPETRMGLSYRSAITLPASGSSQFTDYYDGSVTNSTVSANFPLPATTMLSMYHDLNQSLAVMGSAFYTQWSCFNELILNNLAQQDGTTGNVAINENYSNTWNFAVGSIYKFNQHFSVEAGVGHDDTPTALPYRDIRLPDNSHFVGSLGVNIEPVKGFKWSMGWTHIFTTPTPVDNSGSFNQNQSTISSGFDAVGQGTAYTSVNVFGIQLTCDI